MRDETKAHGASSEDEERPENPEVSENSAAGGAGEDAGREAETFSAETVQSVEAIACAMDAQDLSERMGSGISALEKSELDFQSKSEQQQRDMIEHYRSEYIHSLSLEVEGADKEGLKQAAGAKEKALQGELDEFLDSPAYRDSHKKYAALLEQGQSFEDMRCDEESIRIQREYFTLKQEEIRKSMDIKRCKYLSRDDEELLASQKKLTDLLKDKERIEDEMNRVDIRLKISDSPEGQEEKAKLGRELADIDKELFENRGICATDPYWIGLGQAEADKIGDLLLEDDGAQAAEDGQDGNGTGNFSSKEKSHRMRNTLLGFFCLFSYLMDPEKIDRAFEKMTGKKVPEWSKYKKPKAQK